MNEAVLERIRNKAVAVPEPMGSYPPSDVTFLLKDLSQVQLEMPTEDREEAIQSGTHYSEMLPVEYQPTDDYIRLFHDTLVHSASKVARAAAVAAELIVSNRGLNVVLVSLARAGTPIGILIKRYIELKYTVTVPHYSISIIRGKGIDENAVLYMLQQHGVDAALQFVDGWTGKGAIRSVLNEACESFEAKYGIRLSDDLAVLADPGHCCETYGTREDFLIPSACLNSTVSGLMSRTVMRDDLIGPDDFHGAKFYREWLPLDVSNLFVNQVVSNYFALIDEAREIANDMLVHPEPVSWKGMQDIKAIQTFYGIDDVNLVKPGVGETTRVLLRRVPWKILVDRIDNPNLTHILMLAGDRDVPVEVFPGLTYSCCGIIKPLGRETE